MKKDYGIFVEKLRQSLLDTLDMEAEKIFFNEGGTGLAGTGDRLFIECDVHEGTREVCGIYTEELYERYQSGTALKKITEDVIGELDKAKRGNFFEKTRNLIHYEKIKGDLFIRLVNRDKHRKELKKAVYRTLGDIAMVLYLKIGEVDNCITSMKIRQEYVEMWGLDKDKVFEEALENTLRISPPRIYYWEKLIYDSDYQGEDFMEEDSEFKMRRDAVGNCLSTTRRTNGAVAVFLPGVAEKLARLIGRDFYLVFTSIHEVMIHNVDFAEPERLEDILQETIEEATPEEDYLTSSIYRYNKETGRFICV